MAVNPAPLVLGVVLLVLAVGDLLWTTLWVEGGAGPLTALLMSWTWRAIRRIGRRYPRALTITGPVVLSLGLATWIGLL